MAEINASDVKKLREKTGAGIVDCKNALIKANGDFAGAERLLKEMGLAAVAKRAGRSAEEGRAFTYVGKSKAGIMELSCETDFVARNEEFTAKGTKMVTDAVELGKDANDPDLIAVATGLATTIKENIQLRRLETLEIGVNEMVADYIHGESGRVGVLVKLKVSSPELLNNAKVKEYAKDLTLHAAAFSPNYLDETKVPKAYMDEQESIFRAQAAQMDKPDNVMQGIIKGKLAKHLKEICFADQPFVKDEKRSVRKVAVDLGTELGGTIELVDYRVYRAGEEL
ncbi:MAG: translation elongation factor Ts [Spirochaetales bacterium]|nr:translation elongation factor Ts [Spirochaetales bacterium]